jgi:hypothetical protein
MRKRLARFCIVVTLLASPLFLMPVAHAKESYLTGDNEPIRSFLASSMLVAWYGNPRTDAMGVLGEFSGDELASRLQEQAAEYSSLTDKSVVAAYQLIAVVAQDGPGSDGMWRLRESGDLISSMLDEARAHGFKLILDVQPGESTVQDELAYLRPWLEQPDVFLALDPEFDMWKGQTPGVEFGHMNAEEVNYAIAFLDEVVRKDNLPPKVLIVHQFTENMLPDKENIGRSPVVDLVLDMDGFGDHWEKLDTFRNVMARPLEYVGVKLFYKHDPGMLSPGEVVGLEPSPSVVIYQ